VHVHCNVAIT